MSTNVKETQVVLSWLPGYIWSHGTLKSTGAAIPPSSHMDPNTGEIVYYVRPVFREGATVGLFLKRTGIEKAIAEGKI